ncbi:flagellar hook-basal body complex protein [Neobacillus niacini]|uniref:flagellar hook-basal body complex protein n=1 Tax=Neobacillus niacini TaxID=86668 RepID=UPI00285C3058|nr:flagellar hook-basal body complex protein [Neobacillus niacini]MDR7001012.1 flagellar hook protein FlgE [Neobacillus niacini]
MLKSLYSGVSGMKGFQTKLDVIGNNVANVNTVGFKKGRVMFQDIINQNIAGATAPTTQSGGVNPKQVGLGTKVGSIDTIHTPGSPMTTGVGTDLAIDGDAYFVVSPEDPSKVGTSFLTKAGNFTRDANGNLVNSNGYFVTGVYNDSNGDAVKVPINIVKWEDANGDSHKFTSYSIDTNGYINVVDDAGNSGKLAYSSGKYYLNKIDPDNPDAYNANDDISIATAVVSNPGGLQKVGNTMFAVTGNSGKGTPDRIQTNKGGTINSGVLEMSNVDLTDEFTEMIVAQRGFQANARTITTSDSILEELINLKR